MRVVSWVLLTLLSCLILLGGLGSATIAYFADPSNDIITQTASLKDLDVIEEVATALRGRRGTAAALGLALATLLLFVVLGPYRKGEVWAWWAIGCTAVVLAAGILLRIPALGTSQGAITGWGVLVVVAVALLLDIRRLTGSAG